MCLKAVNHSLLALKSLQFSQFKLGKVWPVHALSWAENVHASVKVMGIVVICCAVMNVLFEELEIQALH